MKRLPAGLVVVSVSLAVLPAAAGASHILPTGGGPPFDVARAVNAKVSVGTPFGAFPGTYQLKAQTNNGSCPPTCFALTLPSTPFGPVTVSGTSNCLNVVAVGGHDSLFKGAITTTSNGLLMPTGAVIVARLIDGDAISIPFPGAPDRAGVFLAPAALPALCSLTAVSTIPLAGGFVSVHQH